MLKHFGCRVSLRCGSTIIGIFTIIFSLLIISRLIISVSGTISKRNDEKTYNASSTSGRSPDPNIFGVADVIYPLSITLLILTIPTGFISGILLVIATWKKNIKPNFVITWLVTTAINILGGICYLIAFIVLQSKLPGGGLVKFEFILDCITIPTFTVQSIYFWLVVYSFYCEVRLNSYNEV